MECPIYPVSRDDILNVNANHQNQQIMMGAMLYSSQYHHKHKCSMGRKHVKYEWILIIFFGKTEYRQILIENTQLPVI